MEHKIDYDIQTRQYFAMATSWDRIDSLAEKYYGISPYAYCGGDPMNYGDYNGIAYYDVSKDGTITMREDEHINDKTDFLFAEGNGSSIEIKDRGVLSGLKKIVTH